jgi:N-methylhydantoinase B
VEGQERVSPILTNEYQIVTDSAGPGKFRGGAGVIKTSTLGAADKTVISYICDRERSIVWGINGGLPSSPHGLSLTRAGSAKTEWLGSVFSNVELHSGDVFSRPTAGGGGYGDPLQRDPQRVCEDVADDYVSVERALTDYGVVIRVIDKGLAAYEVDSESTEAARSELRRTRRARLAEPAEEVARKFRAGVLSVLDVVRHYAVILDWATGEVLETTTSQFREMFHKRTAARWADDG